MKTVWLVFAATAVVLALGAWLATRVGGDRARTYRRVATYVFALSALTAVYPALLPSLGARVWAGGYIALVAVLTMCMVRAAVRQARRLPPQGRT